MKAGDTTTATATAIGTAASPPSNFRQEQQRQVQQLVFPLGLALLGVVGMLWRQKRRASGLRKEMMDREEEKYIARLESKMETRRTENVHYSCDETPTRHQLGHGTVGGLHSWKTSRCESLHEEMRRRSGVDGAFPT